MTATRRRPGRRSEGGVVPLLPGAQAWRYDGNDVGVLCIHGFTGTPSSMRPWAQELATAGYSVELPRLPGHGTRWQDLAVTGWEDWYGEAERAFDRLAGSCRRVYLCALSMGGTLALRLAQQHGDTVAGLVLVNPSLLTTRKATRALPLLSRIVPAVRGIGGDINKPGVHEASYRYTPLRAVESLTRLWAITRADLAAVDQPVLLYRSRVDHVVEPVNGRVLLEGISSTDVTERMLPNSFHVATLDHDAPTIFAGSLEWIAARADAPMADSGSEAAPAADGGAS